MSYIQSRVVVTVLVLLLIAVLIASIAGMNKNIADRDNYKVELQACQGERDVYLAEHGNLNEKIDILQKRVTKAESQRNQAAADLAKTKKRVKVMEEYQFANGAFHTCVFVVYQLTGKTQTPQCILFTKTLLKQKAQELEPSEPFLREFGGIKSMNTPNSGSVTQ